MKFSIDNSMKVYLLILAFLSIVFFFASWMGEVKTITEESAGKTTVKEDRNAFAAIYDYFNSNVFVLLVVPALVALTPKVLYDMRLGYYAGKIEAEKAIVPVKKPK